MVGSPPTETSPDPARAALAAVQRLAPESSVADLQQLAMVAEKTSRSVIVTDATGHVRWVNDSFKRLTGYALDEVLGRTPGALLQCERSEPAAIETMRAAVRAGGACEVEIVNRGRHGDEYVTRIEIQPLRDASDRLTGFISLQSDVTEQVMARKQLKLNEAKAHADAALRDALFHSMSGLIVALDAAGRIIAVNSQWAERPQLPRIGAHFEEIYRVGLVSTDDFRLEAVRRGIAGVLQSGASRFEFELEVQHGGETLWLKLSAVPIRSSQGGAILSHEDITAMRSAARFKEKLVAEARRANDLLTTVIDHMPAGLYWKDLRGRFVGANRMTRPLLGVEDPIGLTVHDLPWPPGLAEQVDAEEQEIIRTREPRLNVLRKTRGSQDRSIWLNISKVPLIDREGGVYGILGTTVDITPLKRVEARLVSVKERLTLPMQAAHIGLFDCNAETGENWFNEEFLAMLDGQSVAEPFTVDAWAGLAHPDERAETRRLCLEHFTGRSPKLRFRFRFENGTGVRWMGLIAQVTARAEDGRPRRISGVLLDVTEQTLLENQLLQAQKLEAIGGLAAGMAHEINSPVQYVSDSVYHLQDGIDALLRVIAAQSALCEQLRAGADMATLAAAAATLQQLEQDVDLAFLQQQLPRAVQRAMDGLERVSTIVRSMRDFAHPDAPEMEPVDLNRAIQSTLVIARNEYKYVAELETALEDLPSVECHAGEINQVILNLVVNAAHAIESAVAGSERRGTITVSSRLDGEHAVVSIRDTGCGIPPAIQGRIFEPFFTTKEVGRGTGQGLAIARSVIEQKHHGSLTFETTEGVGTTFFIRIPVHAPRDTTAERAA